MKFIDYPRIQLFARFLGLENKLGNEELQMYLECVEFIEKFGNIGIDPVKRDTDESVYVPFSRINEYCK